MKRPESLKDAFAELFKILGSMFAGVVRCLHCYNSSCYFCNLETLLVMVLVVKPCMIWKILLGIPSALFDLLFLGVFVKNIGSITR